jgi:hypothetical protein
MTPITQFGDRLPHFAIAVTGPQQVAPPVFAAGEWDKALRKVGM